MTSSDYVTRIARAIYADRYPDEPWDELDSLFREDYCGHARAALSAAMEPDEAMIEAGYKSIRHVFEDQRCEPNPHDWAVAFRAMIKHALIQA